MAKKTPTIDWLERVKKDYKTSWDYTRSHYHTTWDDCWKLYNNKRVKRNYSGVADSFTPIVFSTVESILANVAGGKPKIEFLPTTKEQEKDTKLLNAYIDYIWDKNKLSLKVIPWLRSSIVKGNGVLFVEWGDDYPCVRNIPLKDFFVDPTATNLETAAFAGFRYITTVEELKTKQVLDPETGEYVPMYTNLDAITEDSSGRSEEKTDKEDKDMLLGSTLEGDAQKNQVEVIYYLHRVKNKLVEVANRDVVIRDEDAPYQRSSSQRKKLNTDTGKLDEETVEGMDFFYPFAIQRNYIDESLFYAKGDVEVIADIQELLNDTSNQKIDNISYVLNNMWTLDPAYADRIEEVESVPGAVYPFPDGALKPIDKPIVTRDADVEIARLKDDARQSVGADEVTQGIKQDQQATATEINRTAASAGQRFAMKLMVLENEGFKQLADILFKMVQLFVTEEVAVRVVGAKGVDFPLFDPQKYKGEYEPRVQLDSTIRQEKEAKALMVKEMGAMFMADPLVNPIEIRKEILKTAFDKDDDEVEMLLNGQPQMDKSGMPIDQGPMQSLGDPSTTGMPMPGAPDRAQSQNVDPTTAPVGDLQLAPADLVKLFLGVKDMSIYADVSTQILSDLGFDVSDLAGNVQHGREVYKGEQLAAHKQNLDTIQAVAPLPEEQPVGQA